MTATEHKQTVVAVLYRETAPPRLQEIEELADVRLAKADGLAKALDGADVLWWTRPSDLSLFPDPEGV